METILIFHLASIGDTIVALPALRLIKNACPNKKIVAITARHSSSKASGMETILGGMDLIDDYLFFNLHAGWYENFKVVRTKIRDCNIKILIYLNEPAGILKRLKHYLFFKACGVQKIVGMQKIISFKQDRIRKKDEFTWESISEYLVRKINVLGSVDATNLNHYDLNFKEHEKYLVDNLISSNMKKELIAISIGSKLYVKDWGDKNWERLLGEMSKEFPNIKLLIVGSSDEYERSQRLTALWEGRRLNLCGQLSVRESAYLLSRVQFFLGHDSGPMHLAAAVGTSCIAIFSSRSLPGIWFPIGANHDIFYTPTSCQGCELNDCVLNNKKCINSITVESVLKRVRAKVGALND